MKFFKVTYIINDAGKTIKDGFILYYTTAFYDPNEVKRLIESFNKEYAGKPISVLLKEQLTAEEFKLLGGKPPIASM